MSDKEVKDALKEALKEWLDEKLTDFGKWSLKTLTALTVGAITFFILKMYGWKQL